MKKYLFSYFLVILINNLYGQKDPYSISLHKYLTYRANIHKSLFERNGFPRINPNEEILVLHKDLFTLDSLPPFNLKEINEQKVNELIKKNPIELFEIYPIFFSDGNLFINVVAWGVGKNGENGTIRGKKGYGVYKISYNCDFDRYEVITILEEI